MKRVAQPPSPDRTRPENEWPFRALIESATDLIAVLDAEGVLRYVSPSHQRLLGYASEELVGRNAFDLVHPDDRDTLLRTFLDGVAHGHPMATGEFRYHCADGTWRMLEGVGRNLLSDPAVGGIVVTSRDISERRRVEADLRESRAQLGAQLAELELLYRTAPVGLCMTDTELRFVRINDRLAAINGRPAAAHIGLRLRDMVPQIALQIEPILRRVLETGEPALNLEVHGPTPASPDEERDWLVSHYPLVDHAHRIVGVSAVVQDVTEIKRAERALLDAQHTLERKVAERTAELASANARLRNEIAERERAHGAQQASEQRYRELVETVRDIVFTVSDRGTITYMSPAMGAVGLYAPDEVIGRSFMDFVHPDDLADTVASFRRTVGGTAEPIEFRVFTKEGAVRWVRSFSRVVPVAGGGAELRGVLTDVTDRKQAEDRAREQQAQLAHVQRVAAMGEMAAEIAHEINQPLAAIVNFADGLALRLREGTIEPAMLDRLARQIAAEGRRAAEVIRRLRDFVRKGEIQSRPCDLNQLVSEVIELVGPEARRHGIAVRVALDPGVGALDLDRVQIQQVVLNLMRNAIEAITAGGNGERWLTVETRAARGDGGVDVVVRDSGIGIACDLEDKIFEPFFTTKPDGLGMGLAISRSIVEAHGGRLWSEAPGGGATFTFHLPRARP